MQVYDENQYINKNEVIEIFAHEKYTILYKQCIMDRINKNHNYFGTYEDFDNYFYFDIKKDALEDYNKILNKSSILYKRFIVKKFIRNYIINSLYSYPSGLRLNQLKDAFYNNATLFDI